MKLLNLHNQYDRYFLKINGKSYFFVNKRKFFDKTLGTKLKVADASLKALFVRLLHVCFLSMPKSVYTGFIALRYTIFPPNRHQFNDINTSIECSILNVVGHNARYLRCLYRLVCYRTDDIQK